MNGIVKTAFVTAMISLGSAGVLVQTSNAQHVAGGVHSSHVEIDTAMVATGWSALDLLRRHVVNEKDELVGYVHDVIISPDGTASYAIVNVAGFLGIAVKLVAVPTGAFEIGDKRKAILKNATKETLKELPNFQYNPK